MAKNIVVIIGEDKIREMVKIQRTFDIGLVDFDYGFRSKIYPLISEEILNDLAQENAEAHELIIKAGVLYSFVLDIPKIKVHITNYGISQHDQAKAKNAQWWDVRDLGLSWIRKADEYFSMGLKKIGDSGNQNLRDRIAFFKRNFPLVGLEELNNFYSIHHSPHLYLQLCKLMRDRFDELMLQFKMCMPEFLLTDKTLSALIKEYQLNQMLLDAMYAPGLIFLNTGMVLQYEELPWQKSAILGERILLDIRHNYTQRAETALRKIFEYLDEHRSNFPCYTPPEEVPKMKIIRGKGGLYL